MSTDNPILIRKASGEEEPFSPEKLRKSLHNAGADHQTITKVVTDIEDWLFKGVTTKQIYSRAFLILRKHTDKEGIPYKLKQAILELGPSGFPFEILIGQLFKKQGYKTEIGIVVDGNCVTHEMDVIATKDNTQHLTECKYSKHQGKQISVQVPLYVRSRVNDIVKKRRTMEKYHNLNYTGWVITNTRFSDDSLQYGTCSGLNLLGWDYPRGKGLKTLIEEYKIYPITILTNLTKQHKQTLLKKNIVCCNQLNGNLDVLNEFKFTKRRITKLTKELSELC
ncbi:MAG: ATP cone domain-containing protein [Salinivirgaceae bacterium]